ncbi:hypothetical protein R1flu_025986 [Riccia fluitans]|uniref:Uncharacterized protein n=1 Tax=Riccia fluitans TaxID=41844 RepID=A0ABD1XFF2_9MARC
MLALARLRERMGNGTVKESRLHCSPNRLLVVTTRSSTWDRSSRGLLLCTGWCVAVVCLIDRSSERGYF